MEADRLRFLVFTGGHVLKHPDQDFAEGGAAFAATAFGVLGPVEVVHLEVGFSLALGVALGIAGTRFWTIIEREIETGINSLFSIMGFRRNLLDHLYQGVNIGMAWNRNHFVLTQDYEGDYVEYDRLPTITGNILRCSARVKNRARLQSEDDLAVDIWYDPLPQPLTVGLLLR